MVINAAIVVIEEVLEAEQSLLGFADSTIHVVQLLLHVEVEKGEALSSSQLDVLTSFSILRLAFERLKLIEVEDYCFTISSIMLFLCLFDVVWLYGLDCTIDAVLHIVKEFYNLTLRSF